MKIIGTEKKKALKLKEVNLVLTMSEIDDLINFLVCTKESFTERQADCSVKKIVEKNGVFFTENITSYNQIVKSKNTILDCHMHYKDWSNNDVAESDIIIHTIFKAEKDKKDSFIWTDKE